MNRWGPLVMMAVLLSTASFVRGQSKVDVQLKTKKRDLDEVKTQLEKKRREIADLEKKAHQINKKVKLTQDEIDDVEKSLLYTMEKTTHVENDLAHSKSQHDRLVQKIEERKHSITESIQMYLVSAQLSGSNAALPTYSRQILRSQLRDFEELKTGRKLTSEELAELTATYMTMQRELQGQQSHLKNLKSIKSDTETSLKKTLSRRQVVDKEVEDLAHTAEELAALIDVLRSTAKTEKEAEIRARQKKIAMGVSPILPHSLPWPVAGKVIRSFGRQKHPTLGTPYISNGLLIQAPRQSAVKAVGNGTVLYAGEFMNYGPMVVIEHKGDWFSVYGKLNNWTVEKGQKIKKGEPIGVTGVTDQSEYLAYFELRFFGKPTNPAPWLTR